MNKISSQKGLSLILLLLIVVILAVGALILSGKISLNKELLISSQNSSPDIVPTVTTKDSTNEEQFSTQPLQKRQFDPNSKMIEGYLFEYPEEITNISDSDLIGMSCSKSYTYNYGNFPEYYTKGYYYKVSGDFLSPDGKTTGDKYVKLTDPIISSILSKIEVGVFQKDKIIDGAIICQTEDSRYIIKYDSRDKGPTTPDIHFAVADKNLIINEAAVIPVGYPHGGRYFSCFQPLALTKDNSLYFNCSAGDGGYLVRLLVKIGLNDGSVKKVIRCEGASDMVNCE